MQQDYFLLEEKTRSNSNKRYIGYFGMWLLIALSEIEYGTMSFMTTGSSGSYVDKAIKAFYDDPKFSSVILKTINFISISGSISDSSLTVISLVDMEKLVKKFIENFNKGYGQYKNSEVDSLLFWTNIFMFCSAIIIGSLSGPAGIVDFWGKNTFTLTTGVFGFIGMALVYGLKSFDFIFNTPILIQNLGKNINVKSLKRIFSFNMNSIGFLLRTIVSNGTRGMKFYGLALYEINKYFPQINQNHPGAKTYGALGCSSVVYMNLFTTTKTDYLVSFKDDDAQTNGDESKALDSIPQKNNSEKCLYYMLQTIFMILLTLSFLMRTFSSGELVASFMLDGKKDSFSKIEGFGCLAIVALQLFGSYQFNRFVKVNFTDPLSKKLSHMGSEFFCSKKKLLDHKQIQNAQNLEI